MPRYFLPNGKPVYTEKPIPDEELDSFMESMMATNETPTKPTSSPVDSGSTATVVAPTSTLSSESVEPPPPGIIRRGWDFLNQPTTTIPSQIGHAIEDKIAAPSPYADDTFLSRLGAQTRGFMGGATGALGDIVSGLTSPINIGAA